MKKKKRGNKHISVSAFATVGYLDNRTATSNGRLREYDGVVLGDKFYTNDNKVIVITGNKRVKYVIQSKEATPTWATARLIKKKEAYERELDEAQHQRADDLENISPYKSAYAVVTSATLKTTREGRELTEVIDYGVVLGKRFYNIKGRATLLTSERLKKVTFLPTEPTWATEPLKEMKRAYDIEVATHGAVTMEEVLKKEKFKGFSGR